MFVKWINLNLLFGRDVIVRGKNRARRADVIPQAIADHGAALDPRCEVQIVAIAQRADALFLQMRERFHEMRDFDVWPSR